MDFEKIWFYIKRFFKRTIKKIKKITIRHFRRLIRHAKAGDYSILIYTVVGVLAVILILSLLFKGGSSKKKKNSDKEIVATMTDVADKTTESVPATKPPAPSASGSDAPQRHPIPHDELVAKAKTLYEQNKDLLIIINSENPLKEGYTFEQHQLNCGEIINALAYDDLSDMLEACNDAGYEYNIISGYRDREKQQQLIDEDVENYKAMGFSDSEAEKLALKKMQKPGHSEHETGLSIDISSEGTWSLSEDLMDDKTFIWLSNHCHEYGFIVRYPVDKADITGIEFEPWHFRYVGKETSMLMYDNDLTLEDFYDLLSQ